jgi:hypothetical protein
MKISIKPAHQYRKLKPASLSQNASGDVPEISKDYKQYDISLTVCKQKI